VKDYFLVQITQGGKQSIYWCSSSSWVFSELPQALSSPADVQKLWSINNFFTGEYDTVLFEATGEPQVIDHEQGIYLYPKPITELDRLSYVVDQLRNNFAVPKHRMKFTPTGTIIENEAFNGLAREEVSDLNNWQFTRAATESEVISRIERGEAVYTDQFLDSVSNDKLRNAWSVQYDQTNTVATLKSQQWPGLIAYHRSCTSISGYFYFGDGISNQNLPFMV
jgi:hypothetical protein